MANTLRALIIDDDPLAAEWLAFALRKKFPNLEIETRETPDLSGIFNLYFLDNDFNGKRLSAEMATAIRAANPTALIVAFSARLDSQTLKSLVNAGCDGACEKNEPSDIAQMMRIVAAYIERRECECQEESKSGIFRAVSAIRTLLREWNRRLDVTRQDSDQDSRPAPAIYPDPASNRSLPFASAKSVQ